MALTGAFGCSDGGGISGGQRPVLEVFEGGRPILENGTVTVSSQIPTRVTIKNTGNADLLVKDILLDATPVDAFQLLTTPVPSADEPLVIAADADHEFTLYFDSTKVSAGDRAIATIHIDTNMSITGATSFEFRAAPEAAQARLVAQPSVVDFQVVQAGQSSTKMVSLLNTGSANLEITSFFLSGHPGYSVTLGGQTYNVTAETAASGITLATPITVGVGSAESVEVKYTATGSEAAEGDILFKSNDPTAANGTSVKLFANVAGPCIKVNPPAVDFGGKLVGQQSSIEVEVKSCGDRALEVSAVTIVDDAGQVFGVDTAAVGTYPITIQPDQSVKIPVTYLPKEVATVGGDGQFVRDTSKLRITSNAYLADYDVDVSGFGTDGSCPTAVITCSEGDEVLPQTRLHCSASASTASAGQVTAYQWSVRQPNGSNETIRPSPTQRDIQFDANIVGSYTFVLDVFDQFGTKSCAPAEYEVLVTSDEAIHVELIWHTPGDVNETDTGLDWQGNSVGSDVDLHVLHQNAPDYFDDVWDTYWLVPSPNWGGMGTNDDPSLDRDDTDGAGPENFNLAFPEFNKTYTVGVHYWDDWGFGTAYSTVRVYIYGQLRFNWNDVLLVNHDMWNVCEIQWPSGNVTPIGGNNPDIESNYPVPLSAGGLWP